MNGAVGTELAHIKLMRDSTQRSGTPSNPIVRVVRVLLYGYILLCDTFQKKKTKKKTRTYYLLLANMPMTQFYSFMCPA